MPVTPPSSGLIPSNGSLHTDNTWTGINTFDNQVQWSVGQTIVVDGAELPGIIGGNYAEVTSATAQAISSFVTTGHVGTIIRLTFADSNVTLINTGTTLQLPGSELSLAIEEGDEFTFIESSFGNFRCIAYALKSGQSIADQQGDHVDTVTGGTNINTTGTGTDPIVNLDDAISLTSVNGIDLTSSGDNDNYLREDGDYQELQIKDDNSPQLGNNLDTTGHMISLSFGPDVNEISGAGVIDIGGAGNVFNININVGAGTDIETIAFSSFTAGSTSGTTFQLVIVTPVVFFNAGAGNIKTPNGVQILAAAGDVLTFLFDGTNQIVTSISTSSATAIVESVTSTDSNVLVDNTDSENPTLSMTVSKGNDKYLDGSGVYSVPPDTTGVDSVTSTDNNILVDNTDTANPKLSMTTGPGATNYLDGSGNYSIPPLLNDTTPQLGGGLDTNSKMVTLSVGTPIVNVTAQLTLPVDGNYFDVESSVDITSFAFATAAPQIGTIIRLRFQSAFNLVHNDPLIILPTNNPIAVEVNDVAEFVEIKAGDFRCLNYMRDTGEPLVGQVDSISGGTNINITGTDTDPVVNLDSAITGTSVNGVSLTNSGPSGNYLTEEGNYKELAIIDDTTPTLGGELDTGSHRVKFSLGATLVAASTLTPGNDGNYFDVDGTTTISSIAYSGRPGTELTFRFTGSLVLESGGTAGLFLPRGTDITTQTNDVAIFINDNATRWRLIGYFREDGTALFTFLLNDPAPKLGGTLDTNANLVQWSKGGDLASASLLPVISGGNYAEVTGFATIDSFTSTGVAGTVMRLRFTGNAILKNNANISLPTPDEQVDMKPGDQFTFVEQSGTNIFYCTAYALVSGRAIDSSGQVDGITPGTNISVSTSSPGSLTEPEVSVDINSPLETNENQIRQSEGENILPLAGDDFLEIPDDGNYFRVGFVAKNDIFTFLWALPEPVTTGTEIVLSFDLGLIDVPDGLDFNLWLPSGSDASRGGTVGAAVNMVNNSTNPSNNFLRFTLTTTIGERVDLEFNFENSSFGIPSESQFFAYDSAFNELDSFLTNGDGLYVLNFVATETTHIIQWQTTTAVDLAIAQINKFTEFRGGVLIDTPHPNAPGELHLPTGVDIEVEYGDVATFRENLFDNVRSFNCVSYMRGDGTSLAVNLVDDLTPQLGGSLDTNSHIILGSRGADISADGANELTLGTDGNIFNVSGNDIDSIRTSGVIGTRVELHFTSVLTLIQTGVFTLPAGGEDIETVSGDTALFQQIDNASAVPHWKCDRYTRADGTTLGGVNSVDTTDANILVDNTDTQNPTLSMTTAKGATNYLDGSGQYSVPPHTQGLTAVVDDPDPHLGGVLDTNKHRISMSIGADIPSQSVLPIPIDGNYFTVTGTTTIDSFASSGIEGTEITLRFESSLILEAIFLTLPNNVNITTQNNDIAVFVNEVGVIWVLKSYLRHDGTAFVTELLTDLTPQLGGNLDCNSKQVNLSQGAPVDNSTGSANHIDITAADGNYFEASTLVVDQLITAFVFDILATPIGTTFMIRFLNDMELAEGATFEFPNNEDIFAKTGDIAMFVVHGDDLVRLTNYLRFDGTSLDTNIVDDTTPQLGGVLDANDNRIDFSQTTDVSINVSNELVVPDDGNFIRLTFGGVFMNELTNVGNQGTIVWVQFQDSGLIVHSPSFVDLPGQKNINASAGDHACFQRTGGSLWTCIYYTRLDTGGPVVENGWTLIAEVDGAGSNTMEFQSVFNDDYTSYRLEITDVVSDLVVAGAVLSAKYMIGSNQLNNFYNTAILVIEENSSSVTVVNETADNNFPVSAEQIISNSQSGYFITEFDYNDAQSILNMMHRGAFPDGGAIERFISGTCVRSETGMDGIIIFTSSGNFESGIARIYGLNR